MQHSIFNPLATVILIAGILYLASCIFHYAKNRSTAPMVGYTMVYIAHYFFLAAAFPDNSKWYCKMIHEIFLVGEFLLFILYIKHKITGDSCNRMILFFITSYCLATAFHWIFDESTNTYINYIIIAKVLMISVACFSYFLEIIIEPPDGTSRKQQPFIIIGGIFLQSLLSTPNNLCHKGVTSAEQFNILYASETFSYFILFLSFFLSLAWQNNKQLSL